MKTLATAIAIICALSASLPATSIAYPQVVGKKASSTGETSNKAVRCILREDNLNAGAIAGELIIDKGYIGAGVDLITCDDKGNLICSSTIAGRE